MSIVLHANHQLHLHLCASDRDYQQLASNNLLYYEVACWGLKNGYTSLHMGSGVGGIEDSLFRFKKGFNKNSDTQLLVGEKIFDENKYNILTNLRKLETDYNYETEYIPAYRG
jgi:lipid II:glycine glycyltransferase (peptidoglycan interpeptide bridge formation enzyme)